MYIRVCILVRLVTYIVAIIIHNIQISVGSQVLLDNTERFAELLAMSLNSTGSGKLIRISRPNIGEQSVEHKICNTSHFSSACNLTYA